MAVPTAITVESDGSVEGSDSLKTTSPGGATGLNVFEHSLDAAARHPLVGPARVGLAGLGPRCRACSVVRVCGGGMHAHRYSAEQGFLSPSVYCDDLYRMVRHIRARVADDLDALRRVA